MKSSVYASLILFLIFASAQAFTPDDVSQLRLRSPLPAAGNFSAINARGEQVVAVTESGEILTSNDDGVTWSANGPYEFLRGDRKRFETFSTVSSSPTSWIVGGQGSRSIFRSTDGIAWDQIDTPRIAYRLGYGNGRFVGISIGSNSNLVSDDDGLTWSLVPVPSTVIGLPVGVHYFDNLFHLVTQQTIHTSPDGETWTQIPITFSDNQFLNLSTRVGDSLWATGRDGLLYTLSPGGSWTRRDLNTDEPLTGLAQPEPDGGWLLYQTSGKRFSIAADFSSFMELERGQSFRYAVTTESGAIAAVSGFGRIYRKPSESEAFIEPRSELTNNPESVAFHGDRFVLVDEGEGLVFTSEDGQSWTFQFSLPSGQFFNSAVKVQGGNFVIFSDENTFTSPNGLTWTENPVGFSPLNGRLYNRNEELICAITRDGGRAFAYAVSADGITWEIKETSNLTFRATNLAYGEGLYATAEGTEIWTSPDLVTWTQRIVPDATVTSYRNIGYGNGRFLAFPRFGKITVSDDGLTWNELAEGPNLFGSNEPDDIYEEGIGFISSSTQRLLYLPDDRDPVEGFIDGAFYPMASRLTSFAEGNGVLVGTGSGFLMSTSATSEAYEAWVTDHFSVGTSSDLTAPLADPDGDGQDNLEEYARGTDPQQFTLPLVFTRSEGAFGTEYRFEQVANRQDLTATFQYSSDLDAWSNMGVLQSTMDVGNNREQVEARLTGDIGAAAELYLRVVWRFSN